MRLVAHAGILLLKIVAPPLATTSTDGILSEEQVVRLPPRTINDRCAARRAPVARARTAEQNPHVHVVHRSAESVRLCRPRAAVDSWLWEVLTRSGVPTKMLPITRNFHESIRALVRTDDGGGPVPVGIKARAKTQPNP